MIVVESMHVSCEGGALRIDRMASGGKVAVIRCFNNQSTGEFRLSAHEMLALLRALQVYCNGGGE